MRYAYGESDTCPRCLQDAFYVGFYHRMPAWIEKDLARQHQAMIAESVYDAFAAMAGGRKLQSFPVGVQRMITELLDLDLEQQKGSG